MKYEPFQFTCCIFNSQPSHRKRGHVVIQMQIRHLVLLLSQYEEYLK